MAVQGSAKSDTWRDKWTVITQDRSLAAQYEHTLLITPTGCEILTKYE
jgi:methionyl aminopeptidase